VSVHRCPAEGCTRQVGERLLMCGWHWKLAPGPLRSAVYAAWDDGAGAGTRQHAAACDAAIAAVNRKLSEEIR
jgi:hypothetical protein